MTSRNSRGSTSALLLWTCIGRLSVLGALFVVGCADAGSPASNGGTGGDGGSGGSAGSGAGSKCAPLAYEANPASAKYDFSGVDSTVAQFMADYPAVSGVTLGVVRSGEDQIYEKGYGDFDRNRTSLIASTCKVLSAGVILALVDDGLLDLDRPIADYLDWGDYHSTATMRQILSMMSGIPAESLGDECLPAPCLCDPGTSVQQCGQSVFENESGSIAPGAEFRYSGSSWQLAGAVAEIVSNMSWAELVEQKLVAPLGLRNTSYANPGDLRPETVNIDPASLPETDNPYIAGAGYSTVNDYSKVLLMHLGDGTCGGARVLSPEMVQAMQENLVPEGVAMPFWRPEAINYGMGWWKYDEEPGLLVDSGSYGARSILHPDEGWGAIMIIETTSWDGRELRKRLIPAIREALVNQ